MKAIADYRRPSMLLYRRCSAEGEQHQDPGFARPQRPILKQQHCVTSQNAPTPVLPLTSCVTIGYAACTVSCRKQLGGCLLPLPIPSWIYETCLPPKPSGSQLTPPTHLQPAVGEEKMKTLNWSSKPEKLQCKHKPEACNYSTSDQLG